MPRRLVTLVSAVILVDTMFYAVVAPLLPTLTDDLHLSKAAAGLLTASYPAGTLLGSLPGGVLAARWGPRQTVLVGLALMAVSTLVFGFAHDVVLLDSARFVQGIGGACSWSGALAWLIAEAPAERRGGLIGTALGWAIAGSLLGPVLGAAAEATSPEVVFSSVVLLAAGLAAWAVRLPTSHRPVAQGLGDVMVAIRRPALRRGMWLMSLPAVGFGVLGVLGPLRLDRFGFTSAAIGATYLVAAAAESIVSPVVGRLSDRRGRLVPIRRGLVAAGLLALTITLPGAAFPLAVLIVVTTIAFGFFWAPAMAMVSDAAEAGGLALGYAFALVNAAWALGQVAGSGLGGAMANATTDAVPLTVVSALCLATFLRLRGRDLSPAPYTGHGEAISHPVAAGRP